MIGIPVVFYFYEKNNGKIKDISDNYSFISYSFIVIIFSYILFSLHYLSIQNPNKVFNKEKLVINTYYNQEYKSVRTRSDSQLWVKNSNGRETINYSILKYGRCPYAYDYGENIDIGFIDIRKNLYRAISGKDKPSIAYYIKFGDKVITSEYFVKKYDNEMKQIYLFLLSLNPYDIFILYKNIIWI